MTNSVDTDQSAPVSTLFAQTCLSEYLGSLQLYCNLIMTSGLFYPYWLVKSISNFRGIWFY